MIQSVQFKMQVILEAESPPPPVLGIEITRIRIPVSAYDFDIPVSLKAEVYMGRHESVRKMTAFRLKHGGRITIETVDEVLFIPEHHLIMGGNATMISFSHSASSLTTSAPNQGACSYISLSTTKIHISGQNHKLFHQKAE
jgi:hypothetical protein